MSTRLRDLIKTVRSCKTAAEERAAISKECAAIRTSFKDEDAENRHRNVAKLLYIHMLGYPTHFGQMECLKLIVSPFYADKRIGYLGLMLLLDERQEVLMLVTNSLKNDLSHPNQFIAGLALCSLGNIASQGIARDCAPEIEKLLASTNPYIRKKAALCAIRIVRKVPELLENFVARSKSLLNERNHGVILTGLTLIIELCEIDTGTIDYFRKQQTVPILVRLLKNLVLSGYAPEHDVSGITDPFVQVKLLRLLRILGKGDTEASDAMNDILAQVATNTESTKNVGNSILYECVLTIMSIESESGLKVMAINILGRFLLNRDNNIRYVALNTLSKVVNTDIQAVQRHRNTIVDCLKDPDVSIRRRALDLIYSLVNESNIRILVRELLNFLLISDVQFRPELVAKLCMVTEKYAPTKRWHVDTILRVMSIGGNFIPDDVPNNIVTLISSSPELHSYAVQKLYLALTQDPQHQSLVQVGVWCIGEFGDLLIAQDKPNDAKADEENISISVSESDALTLLEHILKDPSSTSVTRQYTLTAVLKLSSRFSAQSSGRIQDMISYFKNSINVELQQRSCEYIQMFNCDQVRQGVLERMPAFEGRNIPDSVPSPTATERPAPRVAPPSGLDLDLIGLGDGLPTTGQQQQQPSRPAQQQQASAPAGLGDILDIFGPSPVVQQPNAPKSTGPPPSSAANDLLDLLGGPSPMPTTSYQQNTLFSQPPQQQQQQQQLQGGGMNMMGGSGGIVSSPTTNTRPPANNNNNNNAASLLDLMGPPLTASPPGGMSPASPPPAAAPQAGVQVANVVGYNKNGITIVFEATKPANQQQGQPHITNLTATYTNGNPFPISPFNLQAAVPKHLKIQMNSASANAIPPSNSGKVTQLMKVQNTMPGQKPVVLRIKVEFTANGNTVSDMADVNFPANV